jgi:hypothetical protein
VPRVDFSDDVSLEFERILWYNQNKLDDYFAISSVSE